MTILLIFLMCLLRFQCKQPDCFFSRPATLKPPAIHIARRRKKPDWVINEVIRLKALMPDISTRLVAEAFNDRFIQESVGKTFVAYTLRNHAYEIQMLRKKLKNRSAYKVPFNQTWAMDLTFIDQQPVVGVIEHHSRKAHALVPLKQKTSVQILRVLLAILERHPVPKHIRTDNEACFTSGIFRFALRVLNITHQTTDLHCPWQNGRVERFFGTFKSTLATLQPHQADLCFLCQSFCFWYNNVRPHQNLGFARPEDVYQRKIQEQFRKVKRRKPPDK